MKSVVAVIVALVALGGGVARAQSGSPAGAGYLEFDAQATSANVTSQFFGAEGGATLGYKVQVYGEVGRVRDASTKELGAAAQIVAAYLAQTQPNVASHVKEPITFGLIGVRYPLFERAKFVPYVSFGVGAAKLSRKVNFTIAGSDVTSNLSQYGVTVGTDLTLEETKAMVGFGLGVVYNVWNHLIVDLQYRYGHVNASGNAININRGGVGIGVGF
jgi:opacity protein-like surface antigen